MTHRLWTRSALGALLITTICVVGAHAADDKPTDHLDKRVDVEIGGPAFVGLVAGSNAMRNGYWLQFGGAFHFHDDFAVEAYGAWGTGEARLQTNPVERIESDQTVWSGFGGLRWYMLGERGGAARFYTALGGGVISGYLDDSPAFDPNDPSAFSFRQETTGYVYVAPGVRLQAGNRSGLIVRVPFNITVEDVDQTFITPGIAAFVSF